MNGRIDIAFAPQEGAVLRMLGLIERRGFAVRRIAMGEDGPTGTLSVNVSPRDPQRSLEILARQLGRLVEVDRLSFTPDRTGVA